MKRLVLGCILVSAGTWSACASEAPPPVDNTTGATGGTGGSGQGGTTPMGGSGGSSMGGTSTLGGSGGSGAMSGATSSGGSAGTPTGGTAGSTSGSAGMPQAGSGGTSGTGTMMMGGTAGMGGGGGMPSAGMSGSAGTPAGGMSGSAGAPTAGMSGTAGTGGMGEEDLSAVAAPLDGQTILMPCDNDTSVRVCTPRADTSKPCTGTGSSYAGTHSFNEQVTLGGEPGVRYLVTLRIRGMTEGKTYTGGMDRSNSGTQVPADGLYIGGQADNSGNGYNIYFIRTDSPSQYYYLNSIAAGNDTRIRHSVFESDFEVEMPVDGGSKVCLVSADPNTSAIKNCQDPEGDLSMCNPMTLPNLDAATTADIKTQPYNGQFVGITVKSVKRM